MEVIEPIFKPNQSSRLAETMEVCIAQGDWPVGSWIPATRELAQQFEVSRKTVHSALDLLEKRRLIARRPRQGCYVQARPPKKAPVTQKTQIAVLTLDGLTPKAIITADPGRDWGTAIIAGAQEELLHAGKLMTTVPVHSQDAEPIVALEKRLDSLGDALGGIMVFPSILVHISPNRLLEALDRRQIPFITINRFTDSLLHNFVSCEYAAGMRLIGRCLARMGLHRVLFLETSRTDISHSALERIGGLFQGFVMEGAPTQHITTMRHREYDVVAGYDAVKAYLSDRPPAQVIVTMGDWLAQGAVKALEEFHLRIPQDVAVIGATGLRAAHDMIPSLTTLAQPMVEIGRQAGRMLLEMERADTTRITGRIVHGKLVVRQSMPIPAAIQQQLQEESQPWTFDNDL